MSESNDKLESKKLTLLAWTDILRAKGMIDVEKSNRMKSLIEKSIAKEKKKRQSIKENPQ